MFVKSSKSRASSLILALFVVALGHALPAKAQDGLQIIQDLCQQKCDTPNDPADDLSEQTHDHSRAQPYQLHSATLSATQRGAIVEAAEAWTAGMGKADGGMDLVRGSNITGGTDEPTNWDSSSVDVMWEDNYPSSFAGCNGMSPSDPVGDLACTRIDGNQAGESGGHRHHDSCTNSSVCQVDTVFEESLSWPSDKSECGSLPPESGESDIGARDGAGGYDFRADQQTVAAHEFGHWYSIGESTNRSSIMYPEPHACFVGTIDGYSLILGYNIYEQHH